MAEGLVAILTGFLVIFLPYVFWRWINRRNKYLQEQIRRAKVHHDDIRANRLKRFASDNANEDSQKETCINKSNGQTDEKISVEEGIPKETESSLEKLLDTSNVDSKSTIDDGTIGDGTIDQDDGTNLHGSSKQDISQRWVTLKLYDEGEDVLPETRPLSSLQELRSWNEGFDEYNISTIPLMVKSEKLENRARVIVCHDMKGGYLEDRFVQGYPSTDCYRLYHWQYIDIFIYFSHHFITIPPPCWTMAAHKHGTRVLGTFITEWEDGAKLCAELFSDKNCYQNIVNQLVLIAKYYGFDGWLINIENPIQPSQVNNLIDFVDQLTKAMHHELPCSQVIWYDSVTYKGELKWQNELNAENRVFFDVSDGIFLNYIWNESKLALSSQQVDVSCRYGVYVGVDVFGRGCFGGGGWNTNKATKVIKNHDLSVALFAPGWVFENYQSSFEINQNKFWDFIAPHCHIRTLEFNLPFITSFCHGYGDKVYRYGKAIYDKAWTHLGTQQIQPSYTNQIYSLGNQDGVSVTDISHCHQDGYNGGGCLLVQGSVKTTPSSSKAVIRLFKTDISLPSTVLISVTTKVKSTNLLNVALQLHMDKRPTYIMLCPESEEYSQDSEATDSLNEALMQRYGIQRSRQLHSDHLAIAVGQEHYRLYAPLTKEDERKMHVACCGDCNHGDCNHGDVSWVTRYYFLAEKDLKMSNIKEIRLVLINKTSKDTSKEFENEQNPEQFDLLVGEIKIIDAVTLRRPLAKVTQLRCCESEIKAETTKDNMVAVSLTLCWSYDSTIPWQQFEIYHKTEHSSFNFVGLSFVMSFVVTKLVIPRHEKEISLTVQTVDNSQRRLDINCSPSITIKWT